MYALSRITIFFFFNDTATTEIYTLSLHDALPIYELPPESDCWCGRRRGLGGVRPLDEGRRCADAGKLGDLRRCDGDRKSTRLNSSHSQISYAVFCLKKKTTTRSPYVTRVRTPR